MRNSAGIFAIGLLSLIGVGCADTPAPALSFRLQEAGSIYQSHTYGRIDSGGRSVFRFGVLSGRAGSKVVVRVSSESGRITVRAYPEGPGGSILGSKSCRPIQGEPVPVCELILSPLDRDAYRIEAAGDTSGALDFYLFVSIQGATPG